MNKPVSLQIQAVLYHNKADALERSLFSLANAVYRAQQTGLLDTVTLFWGDASAEPLFSEAQLSAVTEKLQTAFPAAPLSLQYVFFHENTGYGKGHNRLFTECNTDFLMILNPDILVCHDFFGIMLPPFQNKRVGLTEARQTPVEHPKQYCKKTGETYWSSGACFIIPAALYRTLGGFDDNSFFMYSEDVDLSFRIRQKGKILLYQPNAPVYHGKSFGNRDGKLEHTKTELRCSIESQLILAYKWKQNHLLSYLISVCRNGDEFQKAALQTFEERVNKGELKQIEGSTSVFKSRYLDNRYSM